MNAKYIRTLFGFVFFTGLSLLISGCDSKSENPLFGDFTLPSTCPKSGCVDASSHKESVWLDVSQPSINLTCPNGTATNVCPYTLDLGGNCYYSNFAKAVITAQISNPTLRPVPVAVPLVSYDIDAKNQVPLGGSNIYCRNGRFQFGISHFYVAKGGTFLPGPNALDLTITAYNAANTPITPSYQTRITIYR